MELFKLLGTIAVDNAQAKKAISDTAKEAETGSKKTDSSFKKIGESALIFLQGLFRMVCGLIPALWSESLHRQ